MALCLFFGGESAAQTPADLYRAACAACHGVDGKGASRTQVGFETPLPDFTDCAFTTSEADVDWNAVVHLGGRVRALDRMMPAFGEALSSEQIQALLEHVRRFCASRAWPHGNLNLPRPLVTEKAFPENEAFAWVSFLPDEFIETRFVYERRIGPRSQVELAVPFSANHVFGRWQRGIGDVAVGVKHALAHSPRAGSIVSAGATMTFPTGNSARGLGRRLRIVEPFAAYGQVLPGDAFLQLQLGLEVPLNVATANDEVYWRIAAGRTFSQGQWGRAWSPMIELAARRELGERTEWDLVPQVQVTLSRRQHVSASAGVRVPANTPRAQPSFIVALLWDWFDGSPFSGWR